MPKRGIGLQPKVAIYLKWAQPGTHPFAGRPVFPGLPSLPKPYLPKVVNGPLADSLGDTNNRVVRFGSLDNSVLYLRVANPGPHHMPPLSTTVVNTQAVDLLATWISVPPLSSIARISLRGDGTLQLTLSGSWGWGNIVEAATNLPAPAWRAVGTNIFDTDGSATFIDTNIMYYPRRYYRLVVP